MGLIYDFPLIILVTELIYCISVNVIFLSTALEYCFLNYNTAWVWCQGKAGCFTFMLEFHNCSPLLYLIVLYLINVGGISRCDCNYLWRERLPMLPFKITCIQMQLVENENVPTVRIPLNWDEGMKGWKELSHNRGRKLLNYNSHSSFTLTVLDKLDRSWNSKHLVEAIPLWWKRRWRSGQWEWD